jgi:hypothetical protein
MSAINGDRARANKKATKRRLRRSQIQALRGGTIRARNGEIRSGAVEPQKTVN